MNDRLDLACSCLVWGALASALTLAWCRKGSVGEEPLSARVRATALPDRLCRMGLRALEPTTRGLLHLGVSANAITLLSLLAGIAAGVLLGSGHFGVAGVLFVIASCGDALDGLVARASHTDSAGGALLDASVDRYEEFFAFGGLAIYFRTSGTLLALTLIALAGSFMVSYGSAQAEARHVAVPPGLMRRPERATCLGVGILAGPIATALAPASAAGWAGRVPIVVAIGAIAVLANVCAVRRIRAIASALTPVRLASAPGTVAGARAS